MSLCNSLWMSTFRPLLEGYHYNPNIPPINWGTIDLSDNVSDFSEAIETLNDAVLSAFALSNPQDILESSSYSSSRVSLDVFKEMLGVKSGPSN